VPSFSTPLESETDAPHRRFFTLHLSSSHLPSRGAKNYGKEENAGDTDLTGDAIVEIFRRKLLADVFALYVKTKNFDWR
jgi:hypothetical protein